MKDAQIFNGFSVFDPGEIFGVEIHQDSYIFIGEIFTYILFDDYLPNSPATFIYDLLMIGAFEEV